MLTGVLIQLKTPYGMVATDSYRLSVKQTPLQSSVAASVEVIVPARTLLELSRIAASTADDSISILPTDNQVLFEVNGISMVSRLIDGQFPNYRQLIPESFDHEVSVDHDELLDAVRRVSLLAQKNTPLRLRFADNTLSVSAESQDVGKAQETIPVQYAGEDLEIGFNPEFLEAGIASVKEAFGVSAVHQPSAPRSRKRQRRRLHVSGHADKTERRHGAIRRSPVGRSATSGSSRTTADHTWPIPEGGSFGRDRRRSQVPHRHRPGDGQRPGGSAPRPTSATR